MKRLILLSMAALTVLAAFRDSGVFLSLPSLIQAHFRDDGAIISERFLFLPLFRNGSAFFSQRFLFLGVFRNRSAWWGGDEQAGGTFYNFQRRLYKQDI